MLSCDIARAKDFADCCKLSKRLLDIGPLSFTENELAAFLDSDDIYVFRNATSFVTQTPQRGHPALRGKLGGIGTISESRIRAALAQLWVAPSVTLSWVAPSVFRHPTRMQPLDCAGVVRWGERFRRILYLVERLERARALR